MFLHYTRFSKTLRKTFVLRAIAECIRRVRLLRTPVGTTHTLQTRSTEDLPAAGEVIVISANLWHDWPLHRRLPDRLEAFASLVEEEGAQVVLLQEVMRTADFRTDTWLANRLGMTSVYARANGHAGAIGFEEGSAVLSSFPLHDVRQVTLGSSATRFVNRIALGAQFQIDCCKLWAFSTHLSLFHSENGRQLAALQGWIEQVARSDPALIGGDFNAHEESAQIIQAQKNWTDTYRTLHPGGRGGTHTINWPWGGKGLSRRLDYIFIKRANPALQILETRHLQAGSLPHSDHSAVLTRLRYKTTLP